MTAVDSSVVIDMLFGGPCAEASAAALSDAAGSGPIVLSDVAFAEVCSRGDGEAVRKALQTIGFAFSPTTETAAIRAGQMMKRYRLNGGGRARIIADFLIGAHALIQCGTLITYDGGFTRDYFKGLKVIVPTEQ